jgi:cytochrome c-type biogenesis protein CcmH/NrfG
MEFWVIMAVIVLGSLGIRTYAGLQKDKTKRLELDLRNKELEIERMKHETKLLEAKGPELPSWLDQSDPEEVRRYREAHAEVGQLTPKR